MVSNAIPMGQLLFEGTPFRGFEEQPPGTPIAGILGGGKKHLHAHTLSELWTKAKRRASRFSDAT